MKRTLAAASLVLLALTGCDGSQSGDSNPDNQIEQAPLPTDDASPAS